MTDTQPQSSEYARGSDEEDDHKTLIERLTGRARYLRDMNRVKSPQLMEEAAEGLADQRRVMETVCVNLMRAPENAAAIAAYLSAKLRGASDADAVKEGEAALSPTPAQPQEGVAPDGWTFGGSEPPVGAWVTAPDGQTISQYGIRETQSQARRVGLVGVCAKLEMFSELIACLAAAPKEANHG
ncbi:MAG TPA: hypothetical protein VKQ27_08775 [Acetobacteraceae bacterium]|nr:hypothetical protein [Acetobacteraceae bacterium]